MATMKTVVCIILLTSFQVFFYLSIAPKICRWIEERAKREKKEAIQRESVLACICDGLSEKEMIENCIDCNHRFGCYKALQLRNWFYWNWMENKPWPREPCEYLCIAGISDRLKNGMPIDEELIFNKIGEARGL